MLPEPVVPGEALAAATARALAAAYGPSELEDDASDDEDPPQGPVSALPRPGRARGMLADQATPPPPPCAPPPSPAAAAVAPLVTAVAATPATPPVVRAAVEPCARAEPPQEQAPPASARVKPMSGDVVTSDGSRTKDASDADDGAGSSDAAGDVGVVAMDVDQGARRQQSPWKRVGGKRWRLNAGGEEDTRELAELLTEEEDEAGAQAPAPRLSAASARPASRFVCTLCAYTAASFASFKRHRDSRHRRTAFLDKFSSGCACGTPFGSRLAAARHAQACASLSIPRTATAPAAAGDLSPTATGANATASAAATSPNLPRPASPELAASPLPRRRSPSTLPYRQTLQSRQRGRAGGLRSPALRWKPVSPPASPWFPRRDVGRRCQGHEESKADDVAMADHDGEWLPRFDGACRANPGPGGVGAALFKPSGPVVWACSRYMPSSSAANKMAEYMVLLIDARAAADHGATHLRMEGDSTLVIQQVRGIFAARSTRMRALRNQVKSELARVGSFSLHHIDRQDNALARVGSFSLHHIDRQDNAHADRLANRALDLRRTVMECVHCDDVGCTATTTEVQPSSAPEMPTRPVVDDHDEHEFVDACGVCGDIDGGEVYAAMRTGPDAVPARRPRLRLRKINDEEQEEAGAMAERLGATLAAKIADASDWESAESYITALPHLLYDKLQPYTQTQRRPEPRAQCQQQQDPRQQRDRQQQSRHQSRSPEKRQEQRPDEHAGAQTRRRRSGTAKRHREEAPPPAPTPVERSAPGDRTAVRRARRLVGRVNSAIEQQRLRHRFDTDEKACVADIPAKVCATRETVRTTASGVAGSADDSTCPILGEELWRFFDSVNTLRQEFAPDAPVGAAFRSALARLPAAPSAGEVEDQLQHVRDASSRGLNDVGYDVYQHFAAQLLPALTVAFKACWTAKRVPQSWKLGVVRLLHKNGAREDPANWRPICLQTAIYKLYSGLLARQLSRFLETNKRLPISQKGFRAFNSCHEHNFVATTLLDQTHRRLYAVWYDLRNAFGSLVQQLMWEVLRRLGGIYDESFFVVGNAGDGGMDPVRQELGVYQGCPLSSLLSIAALVPLLLALEKLDGVGVPLADGVRPRVTAYADDIKVFVDSAAGIKRCHAAVERFLDWAGLRANSAKCAFMPVTRDRHSNPTRGDDIDPRIHGEVIATLGIMESYRYTPM
uniref:Reverse transcriptase domain-containing protein n=1 Tax=Phytophthora ramorum TaxID=164328 RepID=H3GYC6_PHYRM